MLRPARLASHDEPEEPTAEAHPQVVQHLHTPLQQGGSVPPGTLRLAVWQVGMLLLSVIAIVSVIIYGEVRRLAASLDLLAIESAAIKERIEKDEKDALQQSIEELNERLGVAELDLGLKARKEQGNDER